MDEIKFKIALKVNDLYYFMMHHYYSKPAGIIGLVLSIGSLVLLITRWNVTDATAKMLYFIIALLFTGLHGHRDHNTDFRCRMQRLRKRLLQL